MNWYIEFVWAILVDKDIPITIVLFITILQKQYHALSRQIQEIHDE